MNINKRFPLNNFLSNCFLLFHHLRKKMRLEIANFHKLLISNRNQSAVASLDSGEINWQSHLTGSLGLFSGLANWPTHLTGQMISTLFLVETFYTRISIKWKFFETKFRLMKGSLMGLNLRKFQNSEFLVNDRRSTCNPPPMVIWRTGKQLNT